MGERVLTAPQDQWTTRLADAALTLEDRPPAVVTGVQVHGDMHTTDIPELVRAMKQPLRGALVAGGI